MYNLPEMKFLIHHEPGTDDNEYIAGYSGKAVNGAIE
jgi:hypothetical protein